MLDNVLIIGNTETPPTNMPSFIRNMHGEDLSTFEIIGSLFVHNAIYVTPKATQIALLRRISETASIELVIFQPEDTVMSHVFMTEATGLPIMGNIAELVKDFAKDEDDLPSDAEGKTRFHSDSKDTKTSLKKESERRGARDDSSKGGLMTGDDEDDFKEGE
jgi:hypothetical protein